MKTAAIYDASGRYIAPPQGVLVARPAGPWTLNREKAGAA